MPVKIAYDEKCEFCNLVKDVSQRYSVNDDLKFIPNLSHSSSNIEPGQKDRIAIVDEEGRRKSDGIDTVIFLCRRVKIFYPLYPVLKLARLIGVGQAFYDLIARNRHTISKVVRLLIPATNNESKPV